MYQNIGKSVLDFWLSTALIVLFFPAMLLLLFTGSLLTGFRPFFFQKRSGRFGKPFHILKFRTIDPQGNSFGLYSKFLRVSSLDELPQLFNIIMGQMSLVGPRPLYLEYNEHYNERHRKRLEICQNSIQNRSGKCQKNDRKMWGNHQNMVGKRSGNVQKCPKKIGKCRK